jgi:hypothetical protein
MATYDLGNSDFGLSHMPGNPGNSEFGLSHNHPTDDIQQLSATNPDPSVRDFVLNFLFNEDGSASPVSAPQDVPAGPGMGDNFADTQNATDNMILTSQDTGFNDAGNETILAGDGNDSILNGGEDEQFIRGRGRQRHNLWRRW